MDKEYSCVFCCKKFNSSCHLIRHERRCLNNPNRDVRWPCRGCSEVFNTRKKLIEHIKIAKHKRNSWNKGKTKYTDERIMRSAQKYSRRIKQGKIHLYYKGKRLSEEHKRKISEGMKKAHKENRAHNIGMSRRNHEHSWPEKWFIQVLSNEFGLKENVDYFTEFPFERYALDFAWPNKKFCIEIDGEEHERFEECIQRDKRKNESLKNNGWDFIRIKWKVCFHNPKETILMVETELKKHGIEIKQPSRLRAPVA